MSRDGLVHVHMGGGNHAPCGVKVSTPNFNEEIQSSCGDDYSRVTCLLCKALVAKMARLYRKATRGQVKWKESIHG